MFTIAATHHRNRSGAGLGVKSGLSRVSKVRLPVLVFQRTGQKLHDKRFVLVAAASVFSPRCLRNVEHNRESA